MKLWRQIHNEANQEWESEPIDISEFIEDEPIIDYDNLEVPEAAEKYDPLKVSDFSLPNFDLYEVDFEDDNGD